MTRVDPKMMGGLMSRLEANAHRHGWDEPWSAHVIFDYNDQITRETYARIMRSTRFTIFGQYAAGSPIPREWGAGPASHSLFRLALNLNSDHETPRTLVKLLRQPGFLAFGACFEAWTFVGGPEDRAALPEGVRLADVPGSFEMRHAMGVDVDGRVYDASRRRGDPPVGIEIVEPDSDQVEVVGSVVTSMRLIVAILAELPLPEMPGEPSGWDWSAQTNLSGEPL